MGSWGKTVALMFIALFLMSLLTIQPATVKAQTKTIIVPDDSPTIQTAINSANVGDTILVKAGTYEGGVYVNKTISLVGENPQSTIMSVTSGRGFGFTIEANDVALAGFNITGTRDTIGISIFANNTHIYGNNIDDNGNGIWIGEPRQSIRSFNNVISKNNFTGNSEGIIDGDQFTIITENNFTNGICIDLRLSSDYAKIEGNNISQGVINIMSSNNNIITGNKINTTVERAIMLNVASNNMISKNNITGTNFVIQCGTGTNNTITQNNITGTNSTVPTNFELTGLALYGLTSSNVTDNNITSCVNGISLDPYWPLNYMLAASNIVLSGNSVISNQRGIVIGRATNNSIFENNLTTNTQSGICNVSASSNIYHNNFINNFMQINGTSGRSIWDEGYPSGGNYWRDYNGTDANHDGIGDKPYIIDANNTDRYPLMTPFGSIPQPVQSPTPTPTPSPTPPNPAVTLFPSEGPVGTSVIVDGVGFGVNASVTITFNGKVVQQTQPTGNYGGIVAVIFTVPAGTADGTYNVVVTDSEGNTVTVPFTVGTPTSSPTPTPTSIPESPQVQTYVFVFLVTAILVGATLLKKKQSRNKLRQQSFLEQSKILRQVSYPNAVYRLVKKI